VNLLSWFGFSGKGDNNGSGGSNGKAKKGKKCDLCGGTPGHPLSVCFCKGCHAIYNLCTCPSGQGKGTEYKPCPKCKAAATPAPVTTKPATTAKK